MDEKIVKDSQGLAKDLVNDTISRSGVSAWLANMGYSKLADVLMDKNRFPSAQPETHDKRTETHACDLIDRQMAIDGFYEMASDMDYLCTVSDYVSFLESLPSAQPYTDEEIQKIQDLEQAQLDKIRELAYQDGKADAMRWIPISEKFPQEDEDVLLQFPSNQGVGYYEDGDWMINTGDGIYSIIGYNEEKPIAWMPLPEPYKEDDK